MAHDLAKFDSRTPAQFELEHPSGSIVVGLQSEINGADVKILSGGAVRTCRPIMRGEVYIPEAVWP